jgi:hypothetical protein
MSPGKLPATKLVFVYNADSGVLSGLKDLVHKATSPSTYQCALCAVTYDLTSMRTAWKEALLALPLPTEFLHRNEFLQAYPAWRDGSLPAAFSADATGGLTSFISTAELNKLTLEELINLTQQRAQALVAGK